MIVQRPTPDPAPSSNAIPLHRQSPAAGRTGQCGRTGGDQRLLPVTHEQSDDRRDGPDARRIACRHACTDTVTIRQRTHARIPTDDDRLWCCVPARSDLSPEQTITVTMHPNCISVADLATVIRYDCNAANSNV